VVFCALVATFSVLARAERFQEFSESIRGVAVRWLPAWLHGALMAACAVTGSYLYRDSASFLPAEGLAWAFLLLAVSATAAAACAALPWRDWKRAASIPGMIWVYSGVAAVLVVATTATVRSLWQPAAAVTFQLVRTVLSPFVALTVMDPARLILGTRHFKVSIAPECSGLEGVSLLLFFGGLWLFLFRKECRFPQALLLLPIGAVLEFLLNAVRIAALVLIGSAGARQIAAGGFHSQAGWICFNAVSIGLCAGASRMRWFTKTAETRAAVHESEWTPAYVMPLLAMVAAGMLSRAVSGGFEWFYGLRVAAVVAVLWVYRREYRALDWGGWSVWGAGAGVVVFAIWIAGPDAGMQLALHSGMQLALHAGMPLALHEASAPVRWAWIAVRAVSAVVTVPIAEELAFRGFLMRRLRAREFDLVAAAGLHWPSLAISSILFGALHGARWPAGIAAGAIYGLVYARRGRLGDAVLAHGTTNALLAGAVLFFGDWQFW
jgi:exosortase E/protease (VPEID-CTERM system)